MAIATDRLFIDEKDRELYDSLENTDMFKGRTRKEQFLFALAQAFDRGAKRAIGKREGFFLAKDMQPEDEALLDAVAAFDTNSVDVLSDRARVFRIAEEYAHAGIRLLVDEIDSRQYGTFEKAFEKQLHEMYGDIALPGDEEEERPT